MTIAACYVSAEGVVLGADSTSTINVGGLTHHFNYAQKVFEVGRQSSLGILVWGLGSIGAISHRSLIARLGDDLERVAPASMDEVALRWSSLFWAEYQQEMAEFIKQAASLREKPLRSEQEQTELDNLELGLGGGFCVGGVLGRERAAQAVEVLYSLTDPEPRLNPVPQGSPRFWGWPSLINRLIYGIDERVYEAILRSEKWTGTPEDLIGLVWPETLVQARDMPIREAVDWVHASIYTTIKAMKFSHLAPVCGGPIEIAVITADRPFRWVRHKQFDEAIGV